MPQDWDLFATIRLLIGDLDNDINLSLIKSVGDKLRGNKEGQRQVIVMQTWLAWSQPHDIHWQVAKYQLTQRQRQICSVLASSNSETDLGVIIDDHFSISCQSGDGWKGCLHNSFMYKMKLIERNRASEDPDTQRLWKDHDPWTITNRMSSVFMDISFYS